MVARLDTRRITMFLAFAFGIAWLTGLVIFLTGGLAHSPHVAGNLTLALLLMATFYMWAPAVAHILTRLLTREGWRDVGLRPHLRTGWPFWLAAWVLPALLVILGAAIYFLFFPQNFDPTLGGVRKSIPALAQANVARLWQFAITQTLIGILIAPLVNAIATFGEEFGWRAYLLPRLMPLGGRKAALILGVIWGVWHWPVIFMGYEYGSNYPGWPWLGPLLFIVFTTAASILLAWVTLRGGSVWPGVIGHGAINGMAQLPLFFLKGTPNLTIGPAVNGILGGMGFILLAVLLYLLPGTLRSRPPAQTSLPTEDAPRPVESLAVEH